MNEPDRKKIRLAKVDMQLAEIHESILGPDIRNLIRAGADHYGRWLECEDELDALGISIDWGGGCEYPAGEELGIGVAEIDGIRIGTLKIEKADT